MNIFAWFRRLRKGPRTGPTGDQGKFYYLMDYREEYPEIFAHVVHPNRILSELFLFRFWATYWAYRLCRSDDVPEEPMTREIVLNGRTLGLGMFERIHSLRIADTMGAEFDSLAEERFKLYDSVFIEERTPEDMLATKALADALSKQLFTDPTPGLVNYLAGKIGSQFEGIVEAWSKDK